MTIENKMSSHDVKLVQNLVLNLASSVESRAVNIRTFLEEAFRHLGDEHYLLNALLAIRKEVDLMEQDAIESKARSDPEKDRMEAEITLAQDAFYITHIMDLEFYKKLPTFASKEPITN